MSEYKVNGSEGAGEGGLGHDILKKNRNFYIGVGGLFWKGFSPAAYSCFFTLSCNFCGQGSLT